MSNQNISYLSVSQAIEDAIGKYKRKESIEDLLLWINGDINRLTTWAYETDTFFNEDYVFMTSEEELFITNDDLLEYFAPDQLDLKADLDILDFINKRTNGLFDEGSAAHFNHRDKIYITADCEIWGQAGPHFSNFDIYNSKDEYFDHLKNQGYILWFGQFLSHSDRELISMFKKNVIHKYFAD